MNAIKQYKDSIKVNLESFINTWTEEEPLLLTMKIFRVAFFSWLLMHTLIVLPYHSEIFSPDAFINHKPFYSGEFWGWVKGLVAHPLLKEHYLYFIGAQILVLLLGVLGIGLRIVTPLIWFFTLNVNYASGVIMDGGNNLSELVSFYLIFVNTSGKITPGDKDNSFRIFLVSMSNAFILLIKIQVVLVYLSAGIYKLGGSLWQNGMALYYILQSESYGHPMLAKLMVEFPILSLIGTYATLLFQITFPWLVWNKKLRPFYILWGLGLHLGMIFAMGLLTFGSNMCLMFLVFFKDSYYQNITNFLKSFKNGPIEVGIDENCSICNKFSKIIQKLDFYQLVKIDRAHNPVSTNLQSIEKVKRLNAIVVFTEKNEIFYWGMDAIAQIIYKLPFGFLLKPLFYILKFKSFDKKIYTKIANSQMRKNCAEGFCNV